MYLLYQCSVLLDLFEFFRGYLEWSSLIKMCIAVAEVNTQASAWFVRFYCSLWRSYSLQYLQFVSTAKHSVYALTGPPLRLIFVVNLYTCYVASCTSFGGRTIGGSLGKSHIFSKIKYFSLIKGVKTGNKNWFVVFIATCFDPTGSSSG